MALPIPAPIRAMYYRYRWRKRRKEGRSIRIRVTDPAEFLRQLEVAGVRSAVMRWWEEVPTTLEEAAVMPGDVDVLVDDAAADAAARIASRMPGHAALEFRSVKGRFGALASMPYYPPTFTEGVLAARVAHPRGFMIPAPHHRLPLVLFHLCYQKAERSGIPTGTELPTGKAKRDYGAKLRALAAEEGASLPEPLTLASIHEELIRLDWDMQLDALERWPLQSPWIARLVRDARERYEPIAAKIPEVLVFILRDDLTDDLRARVRKQLDAWFDILDEGPLDAAQRHRCLRHLRGGNWMGDLGTKAVEPTHFIVCNDPTPAPVTDPVVRKKQPHVTNARARLKRVLRDDLREAAAAAGGRCRHGLHSSDNRYETLHFLEVIFGDDLEANVARYAEQIVRLDGDRSAD